MSVQVTKHPSVEDNPLGEIYQSMETKNALLKKEKEGFFRITPLVLCRDFICDVYAFDKTDRKFDLYGMKNPKESPDNDAVRLMVTFPNEKAKDFFWKNLQIIHKIEDDNKITSTDCLLIKGQELAFYVQGDKRWLGSYLLLGLYTHLLRVICYEIEDTKDWIKSFTFNGNGNKKRNEDSKLVGSIHPETWEKILSDLSVLDMKEFCGYDPKKEDEYTIHHNSGIYSIFGNHRELSQVQLRRNEHWQHFKEQGTWKLHTN